MDTGLGEGVDHHDVALIRPFTLFVVNLASIILSGLYPKTC